VLVREDGNMKELLVIALKIFTKPALQIKNIFARRCFRPQAGPPCAMKND
jgi:hypothetical protein